MAETLQPDSPLAGAGVLDDGAIQTLAGQWITTIEQFLLRAATAEARAQLAGLIGVETARIEAWRAELLRRLPETVRPALESPPDPGPRPGMGAWIDKGKAKN